MKKKKGLLFCLIRNTIRLFMGKVTVEDFDETTTGGNIYVANHSQAFGPIFSQLYHPREKQIWTIGEMFSTKEAPAYAMEDFWRLKPKWIKWFFWLIAHTIIKWLAPYIFKHADTIPVYKDGRLKETFRHTIQALDDKKDVIIFPECRESYNHIINDFQKHFVDVAKLYTKMKHKPLKFYPVYICPELKKYIIGVPTTFSETTLIEEERMRIIHYLQAEITKMAETLPEHIVVPYINQKKKKRQSNKKPYSNE